VRSQHCFICRSSDSTKSEDAGIEPRTAATLALRSGGAVERWKGFLIYEEMRKYFPYMEGRIDIYDFATVILNFLICEENLIFFFISVGNLERSYCQNLSYRRALHSKTGTSTCTEQQIQTNWHAFCSSYGHFLLTPCFPSTIRRILCFYNSDYAPSFAPDFLNVFVYRGLKSTNSQSRYVTCIFQLKDLF
jgi:hypothetical protein